MKRLIITTDGSAIMNENGNYDSAYAFVIFKDYEIFKEESGFLRGKTNNYAEAYAIYKSTKYIVENMKVTDGIDQVLIVTDSDLCFKSLTTWMFGWLKKTDNEKLVNSTGQLVKNQELLKSTFINILMLMLKIDVKLCHVNSHQSEKEKVKMYEKMNKLIPDLIYEEFEMIYKGNDLCDINARNKLKSEI